MAGPVYNFKRWGWPCCCVSVLKIPSNPPPSYCDEVYSDSQPFSIQTKDCCCEFKEAMDSAANVIC